MAIRTSPLSLAALLASTSPSRATDEICQHLRALEMAAPASAKERRWIEFHWGNDHSADAIWSWGCRSSGQQIARDTCTWLLHHANQEFRTLLPVRIMSCYGYRFPRTAGYDWDGVEGAFTLHGRGGRNLILEMEHRQLPPSESAVRLTVLGPDDGYDPDEMPAIEPLPPDAAN